MAIAEPVEHAVGAGSPARSARVSFWHGDPLRRRMLAVADVASGLAFIATYALTQKLVPRELATMLLSLPLWLLFAKLAGLYDRDHRTMRHLTADELPTLVLWVMASGGLTALVALGYDGSIVSVAMLRALAVAALTAVCLRVLARTAWRRIVPRERVAILGEGPVAQATRRKFELFGDMHADVVVQLSFNDARVVIRGGVPGALAGVDRLVVASPAPGDLVLPELLAYCRAHRVKLSLVPPSQDRVASVVRVTHLGEIATLEYNTWDVSRSTLLLKRLLDLVLAALGLILFSPLFAVIAAAIYIDDGRPVFFRQLRAGDRGEPFRIWKFRTMVVDAEELLAGLVRLGELEQPMFKLRGDPRVTRVGRILRRFSLDELPQLLNVLRGEMSLVGPRPEQVELVGHYSPEHRFRLSAKPGMTGPMQVYGRAELTFDERLAVERDYIENVTLGRDLRILFLTVAPVVRRRGAF